MKSVFAFSLESNNQYTCEAKHIKIDDGESSLVFLHILHEGILALNIA
jgi:hypothetical protein